MDTAKGIPYSFISEIFSKGARVKINSEYFTLDSILGSGGNGVVMKAKKESTQEPVALKCFYDRQDEYSKEMRQRFDREASLTQKIGDESENSVKIIDMGKLITKTKEVPCFVMEFVQGPSLYELNLLCSLNLKEVYVIMKQTAQVLEIAHNLGIIHRDVKPPNILIDEIAKRVVLTDFGVSHELEAKTDITIVEKDRIVVPGTVKYFSKHRYGKIVYEEKEGVKTDSEGDYCVTNGRRVKINFDDQGKPYWRYLGPEIDLSVLASTIFTELLTGTYPFEGESDNKIIQAIDSAKRIEINSDNSEIIKNLFKKSTEITIDYIINTRGIAPPSDKQIEQKYYRHADALIEDLNDLIKTEYGKQISESEEKEIIQNLKINKVEEGYEKAIKKLIIDFEGGKITEDSKNIDRILILYKQRRQQIKDFIEEIHTYTEQAINQKDKTIQKEYKFLSKLWNKLENYGVEYKYKQNTKRLEEIMKGGYR